MKSLKALSLLFICLLLSSIMAEASERGAKAGGASVADSGINSKIAPLEKLQNIFNDADNIEKFEKMKNTIAGGPGEISKKISGLKQNLSGRKENNMEIKERAAAAKKKSSMQKSEYESKINDLRQKISAIKTGEQKSNFVKLASDIEAILNLSNISTGEAEILVNDAAAIIEAAKISDEEKLKGDLESVAAASKRNAEYAKEIAAEIKPEDAKLETVESGDKEAVQERIKETKEKIEEIKQQKSCIRERIKSIKKNR